MDTWAFENGRLVLPENSLDAKLMLFLDQTAEVMAEELAQDFIDHRRVGLGANRVPQLPLDHAERGLRVAALVVVGHELVLPEAEVVEHLLEHAADCARGVCLER